MAPSAPPADPGYKAMCGFIAWLCRTKPDLLGTYAETSNADDLAFLRQLTAIPTPPTVVKPAKPNPSVAKCTVAKTAASAAKITASAAKTTAPAAKEIKPRSSSASRLPRQNQTASPASISESEMETDETEGFVQIRGKKRSLANPASKGEPSPPAKAKAVGPDVPTSIAVTTAPPSDATPMTNGRKERSPPPLFIQDKGKWENVSSLLRSRGVQYTHARTTALGIKVQLASSNDHRLTTRLLRQESIGFHTYALEDERLLRVVLRGIPKEVDREPILKDLQAQGFPVKEVHRLHSKNRQPYDLVLVILDLSPEGKAIFNISKVMGLSGISAESPHRNGAPSQCHRCQLYGHSARFCFARPRCVKCLGDHGTKECSRSRETPEPPSCVLCGAQGHTANYRGCPKAPRGTRGRTAVSRFPPAHSRPSPQLTYIPAPTPTTNAWAKPPSMVQKQHATAPAATPAPDALTSTPVFGNRAAPYRPPPARTPKITPATSKLTSDLELVLDYAQAIDMDEIRSLAQKLRVANSPQERIRATIEHADTIDAIRRYSFGNLSAI